MGTGSNDMGYPVGRDHKDQCSKHRRREASQPSANRNQPREFSLALAYALDSLRTRTMVEQQLIDVEYGISDEPTIVQDAGWVPPRQA